MKLLRIHFLESGRREIVYHNLCVKRRILSSQSIAMFNFSTAPGSIPFGFVEILCSFHFVSRFQTTSVFHSDSMYCMRINPLRTIVVYESSYARTSPNVSFVANCYDPVSLPLLTPRNKMSLNNQYAERGYGRHTR
jgi:hypothetical protein